MSFYSDYVIVWRVPFINNSRNFVGFYNFEGIVNHYVTIYNSRNYLCSYTQGD